MTKASNQPKKEEKSVSGPKIEEINLELLQNQFEEYLELERDEDEKENTKFLQHIKTGKITLTSKHLVQATKNGHLDLLTKIFEILRPDQKRSLFDKDAKGFTLLHHLAKKTELSPRLQVDDDKITKLTKLFLVNGVSINALTNLGATPTGLPSGKNTALILAIKNDNLALFRALIAKNARLEEGEPISHPYAHVNHWNADGKNALDYVMELINPLEILKEKKQQIISKSSANPELIAKAKSEIASLDEKIQRIKEGYLVPLVRSGIHIIDHSNKFKSSDIAHTKNKVAAIFKLILSQHAGNLSDALIETAEIFYGENNGLSDEENMARLKRFSEKYNLFYALDNTSNALIFASLKIDPNVFHGIISRSKNLNFMNGHHQQFYQELKNFLYEKFGEHNLGILINFLHNYCSKNEAEIADIRSNPNLDVIFYSYYCKNYSEKNSFYNLLKTLGLYLKNKSFVQEDYTEFFDQLKTVQGRVELARILTEAKLYLSTHPVDYETLLELLPKFTDPQYGDLIEYLSFIKKISLKEDGELNEELYKKLIKASIDCGLDYRLKSDHSPEICEGINVIQTSLEGIAGAIKYQQGRLDLDYTADFFRNDDINLFLGQQPEIIDGIKEISFRFHNSITKEELDSNIYFLFSKLLLVKTRFEPTRTVPEQTTIVHKILDGSIPISIYHDGEMIFHSCWDFINYKGELNDSLQPHGTGVMEFRWQEFGVNKIKGSLDSFKKEFPIKTKIAIELPELFKKLGVNQYQKYIGEFKDGLFHGQGTLYFINGSIYQGSFKKGLCDGFGIIRDDKGNCYEVSFTKGKLIVKKGDALLSIPLLQEGVNNIILYDHTLKKLTVAGVNPNGATQEKTFILISLAQNEATKDSTETRTAKPNPIFANNIAKCFMSFINKEIEDYLSPELKDFKENLEGLKKYHEIVSSALNTMRDYLGKDPSQNSKLVKNIEFQESRLEIINQKISLINKFFDDCKTELLECFKVYHKYHDSSTGERNNEIMGYKDFQDLINSDSFKNRFTTTKLGNQVIYNQQESDYLI